MLQSLDIAVFALLKYYFRGAVERRLRARGLQFPKAEFLETYSRIRPQAITQENIKSGFRKAGLVPFNSRKALERLPAPLLESTLPLLQAQQISTLQNQHDVQELLEKAESALQDATKKIGKAAVVFHARAVLAEKETEELLEENKKMQAIASRKR
jgi:hypothetical protein